MRPLAGRLFAGIERFGTQTAGDLERLAALGIDRRRLTVTGNLKFDIAAPPERQEVAAALRRLAGGRPVLVAGSTMAGEEEQVMAAFAGLGGGRRAMLLLAPRHPERWDEVERRLRQGGLAVVRRSVLAAPPAAAGAGAGAGSEVGPDVVLLDSMGELAALYSLAAAAFIGGTLVPTGGHNPIEAARFGVPIAVGPSLHNFREIAELFDHAAAWQRVRDAAGLGRAWESWLADPEAARRLGERAADLLRVNRGALARTLEMLAPLLAAVAPGRPGVADTPAPERLAAGAARDPAETGG
jgi:3-deoxy-D-manno-octulosonic-acid transferase